MVYQSITLNSPDDTAKKKRILKKCTDGRK